MSVEEQIAELARVTGERLDRIERRWKDTYNLLENIRALIVLPELREDQVKLVKHRLKKRSEQFDRELIEFHVSLMADQKAGKTV